METYTLPILSPQHNTIHLALFHNVTNVETILSSLRTGAPHADLSSSSSKPLSSDTLSQYAFLDASVIVSRQHVFNAVLQALTSMEPGYNMKTRSWNTEVMWVLWPGHNISESLRQIGLGPKTSSLVVVRISSSDPAESSADAILQEMSFVRGQLDERGLEAFEEEEEETSNGQVGSEGRAAVTDWARVKDMYKLTVPPATETGEIQVIDEQKEKRWVRGVVESTTGIKNVAG